MPAAVETAPKRSKTFGAPFIHRAREMGIEIGRRGRQRVFISGIAQQGPHGSTFETSEGIYNGVIPVRAIETHNAKTKIGAPLRDDYDPYDKLIPQKIEDPKDRADIRNSLIRDGVTKLQAMAMDVSREAARMAGLLPQDSEDGLIPSPLYNPDRMAAVTASGVGDTPFKAVEIYKQLHESPKTERNAKGEKVRVRNRRKDIVYLSPEEASKWISPKPTVPLFPEQTNWIVASDLGLSGWGISAVSACDTGSQAVGEAARLIQEGRMDVVVAGGGEDALTNDVPILNHPFITPVDRAELTTAAFASIRGALSTRNDDPQTASRPFDVGRNGFVEASGFSVVIMESEEHLRARCGKALAEIPSFAVTMDGRDRKKGSQLPTELNPDRVAKTILEGIKTEDGNDFINFDAIFAHATSTKIGDLAEALSLRLALGDELKYKPITALKSIYGHLLGGAGSANIVNGVIALQENRIPYIANLDNPDPEIMKLGVELIREKVLSMHIERLLMLAYGFGGNNSAMILQRPPEDLILPPADFLAYKKRRLEGTIYQLAA